MPLPAPSARPRAASPPAWGARPPGAASVWPVPGPDALARFADLVEARCGHRFADGRSRLLVRALGRRLAARGLADWSAYERLLLEPGGEAAAEWGELIELLVNRETGFFRHAASFEALASFVLPELAARRPPGEAAAGPALWSAGCSTGQEAYSLAMVALAGPAGGRSGSDGARWRPEVTASDLSPSALAQARRGIYPEAALAAVPAGLRARFTQPVGAEPGLWEPSDEVRRAVRFAAANLARPETLPAGAQDVIFCQNVLIYFSPERRLAAARALAERLRPGGFLFFAPGEVAGWRAPGIRCVRLDHALVYQRFA